MRTRVGASIGVALVVAVAACGAPSDAWGSGSDYSVQAALAHLPASADEGVLLVQTADLVAASEQAGVEKPTELDGDALAAWVSAITGGPSDAGPAPVFVPMAGLFNFPAMRDHPEFADELGWSLVDVEAFVEQSTQPETFTVVAGDLDDGSLDSDLVEVEDGVVTAGEGDDYQSDLDDATVARPHGMPLRLAQDGELIAAAPATEHVAAWLAGADQTLADHAGLAAVAGPLDDAGVVAAALVAGASMSLADALAGSPEQIAAAEAELGPMLPAEPFDAVGVGWHAQDGASSITVAYHFASEDAAEAALTSFAAMFADGELQTTRQPLAELLVLEETTRDGQVAVLTLAVPDGESPAVIWSLLQQQDLPFVHR